MENFEIIENDEISEAEQRRMKMVAVGVIIFLFVILIVAIIKFAIDLHSRQYYQVYYGSSSIPSSDEWHPKGLRH